MRISFHKLVRWFFTFMSLVLLALGIAFIWHYIAPNGWLGMQPDGELIADDDWYRYNQRTGWALAFCGISLFVFTRMMRSEKSTSKYIAGSLISLLSSAVLASLAIELIAKIVTQ